MCIVVTRTLPSALDDQGLVHLQATGNYVCLHSLALPLHKHTQRHAFRSHVLTARKYAELSEPVPELHRRYKKLQQQQQQTKKTFRCEFLYL